MGHAPDAPLSGKDVTRIAAARARWDMLPLREPDERALARARIVTRDKTDPRHAPFDMLRTRILHAMRAHGWRSIAVTSPTQGCGKTTTTLNLAFSLGRRREARTLVLELDLVKPEIGKLLGIRPDRSISDLLTSRIDHDACLIRVGERVAMGLATQGVNHSSETLQSVACAVALQRLENALAPDITLFDLPPLFAVDDALAFAPKADCALLIAAEGQSELGDIERAAAMLSRETPLLGVVLTKSAFPSRGGYGYYNSYGYG